MLHFSKKFYKVDYLTFFENYFFKHNTVAMETNPENN